MSEKAKDLLKRAAWTLLEVVGTAFITAALPYINLESFATWDSAKAALALATAAGVGAALSACKTWVVNYLIPMLKEGEE